MKKTFTLSRKGQTAGLENRLTKGVLESLKIINARHKNLIKNNIKKTQMYMS